MIFGYCRISTPRQSIDRQIRNILKAYPDAVIRKEIYTGKVISRPEFQKLLRIVKSGDTIVFDSVSRMSRDAQEGIEMYFKLYEQGVNLVFLKEHYIDTNTYRQAAQNTVPMTGTDVDPILAGINEYLRRLARHQIQIAFDQSEKEVADLRQRTREGIFTAKCEGKKIGGAGHKTRTTVHKKSTEAKNIIREKSKSFGGQLTNPELMKLCGISEPTLLKIKREICLEMESDRAAAE